MFVLLDEPVDGDEVVSDTTTTTPDPSDNGETVDTLKKKLAERDRKITDLGNENAAIKARVKTTGGSKPDDKPVNRTDVVQIVANQNAIDRHVQGLFDKNPGLKDFDEVLGPAVGKLIEAGEDPIKAVDKVVEPFLKRLNKAEPKPDPETVKDEPEPGARGETGPVKPPAKTRPDVIEEKTLSDEIAERNAARKRKFTQSPMSSK